MPNGRVGDHPFTDIVSHGCGVFTPEIDELVRRLAQTTVHEKVANLLWEQDIWWNPKLPNRPQLMAKLLADLKVLEVEAKLPGAS